MERRLAQIISVLLHPLLMPAFGMLIMFNSGTYVSLLTFEAKKILLLMIVTGTFLLPASIIPFMIYRKMITDVSLSVREERFLPMVLTLLFFMLTFFLIYRLPVNRMIHAYLLAVNISLLLSVLVNTFQKISTHMVGLGGITGLVLALILLFGVPMQSFFILAVAATGLAGFARLKLAAHRAVELLSGFTLGLLVVMLVMLLYV